MYMLSYTCMKKEEELKNYYKAVETYVDDYINESYLKDDIIQKDVYDQLYTVCELIINNKYLEAKEALRQAATMWLASFIEQTNIKESNDINVIISELMNSQKQKPKLLLKIYKIIDAPETDVKAQRDALTDLIIYSGIKIKAEKLREEEEKRKTEESINRIREINRKAEEERKAEETRQYFKEREEEYLKYHPEEKPIVYRNRTFKTIISELRDFLFNFIICVPFYKMKDFEPTKWNENEHDGEVYIETIEEVECVIYYILMFIFIILPAVMFLLPFILALLYNVLSGNTEFIFNEFVTSIWNEAAGKYCSMVIPYFVNNICLFFGKLLNIESSTNMQLEITLLNLVFVYAPIGMMILNKIRYSIFEINKKIKRKNMDLHENGEACIRLLKTVPKLAYYSLVALGGGIMGLVIKLDFKTKKEKTRYTLFCLASIAAYAIIIFVIL